ncbi:MAG: hypothetical protein B1H06_06565 [Candidatus Cloacimonas sp. 4484_143]|nr:MAG: hypothetical protein B1H06_06565 [Candidatus Cloacimonas sp. 4484_143]
MKKIMFLLGLILLCLCPLIAEETVDDLDDYEIQLENEFVSSLNKPVLRIINFVNNNTGDVVKSINLLEDNPFSHLPFEKQMLDKGNVQIYSYSDLELTDIFDDFSWMYPPLYKHSINRKIWRADVITNPYITEHYVLLAYSIRIFSNPEKMIGQKISFFIFNDKGNEMFRLENMTDGASSFTLSDDGRYLAYLHGQQIAEFSRIYKSNPGIKIIDTTTGNIVLDKFVPFEVELVGIHSKDNIIVYSTREDVGTPNCKRCSHYILPDKRMIYSASIPVDIFNRLQRYSENGLILGTKTKDDLNTELYKFEKNFDKEKF